MATADRRLTTSEVYGLIKLLRAIRAAVYEDPRT
jgi:hypothetical protein